MKIQVLFFSLLQDITGCEGSEREFPEKKSVTVTDLLENLYMEFPRLREWDSKILVAADQEYVERGVHLHDGQEIAVMPPVQGG